MMSFEAMLDEVVFERANVAVPAGFEERRMNPHVAEARHGAPGSVPGLLRFDTVARVRAGRSARSTGLAVLMHLAALLLIGLMVRSGVKLAAPAKVVSLTDVNVPLPAEPKANAMGGGGG